MCTVARSFASGKSQSRTHIEGLVYPSNNYNIIRIMQKTVHNYAVMISEEDGDVDMDLPRKRFNYDVPL